MLLAQVNLNTNANHPKTDGAKSGKKSAAKKLMVAADEKTRDNLVTPEPSPSSSSSSSSTISGIVQRRLKTLRKRLVRVFFLIACT